jgi:hypothetical protein
MASQAAKSRKTTGIVAFPVPVIPAPAATPDDNSGFGSPPSCAPPPPDSRVPDSGPSSGQPAESRPPQRRAAPPGRMHMRGASARPAAAALRPPPPPAPRTREKSKQRRIGFCSIRGAGGGKSMFSKWEKRKSFRKDSLFPSRERFVNSTGHCGGSTAGHKTPPSGGLFT